MNTDKHGYPACRPAFIFQLAFVLVLAGGGLKLAAEENPYSPIVARNVFALVPIPVHNPADDVPVNPPPKITPNGIMNIFGRLQVLFKVTETTPGQPPKEVSYTMAEGERQDEIEVQKIDEKAAIITFNNHGAIQTLDLAKSSGGGSPPPPAPAGVPGIAPRPFGVPAPGGPIPGTGFGGRFGRNRNFPGSQGMGSQGSSPAPAVYGGQSASSSGANNAAAGNSATEEEPMSPEAQVLMIEANRMATQDAVNQGFMPPLPVTPLTPEDATAQDGTPLVAPAESDKRNRN